MHKTGTTAIQNALDGQTVAGVGYAKLGHANHSVPLMTIFQDAPYYYWKRIGVTGQEVSSRKRGFVSMLEAQLERRDIDTLVLSGEDLGWLSDSEKAAMVDFFEERGHSLRVVCLTRHPAEFVKSALQQRVQGGLKHVTEIHPQYVDRLQFFLGRLGRECLSVADYTAICEAHVDVVRGFNSLADLPFESGELIRHNRAMSLDATRIILRLNQLTREFSPQYFQLLERLVSILNECLPAPEAELKSQWRLAEELLPSSLSDELAFLKREFGIHYEMEQPEPPTEAVEDFLRVPDAFSFTPFKEHLSRSLNSDFTRYKTLDEILYALLDRMNMDASDSIL